MTCDKVETKWTGATGYGLLPVLAIGTLAGYLLAGDLFETPLLGLLHSLTLGVIGAYLFLQWVDLIGEALALQRDPLPADLDIHHRESAVAARDAIRCRQVLSARLRALMGAWIDGGDPAYVMEIARFQSARLRNAFGAETLFALVLLAVLFWSGGGLMSTGVALALFGLTVFARQGILTKSDAYIEARLLSRLPGKVQGTAMTAAELADALGPQIQRAFADYLPQPERMAESVRQAMSQAAEEVGREIGRLDQALTSNQQKVVQTWMDAARTTTTELRDIEKALARVVLDLTGGLQTNAEKLGKLMSAHAESVEKVIGAAGEQLRQGGVASAAELQTALNEFSKTLKASSDTWTAQLKTTLTDHATGVAAANEKVAAHLAQMTNLAGGIDKILHVQESVDKAVAGIQSSEGFGRLLEALSKHLEESDRLLREAAKPRVIRLVETDGEVVEA